MVATHGAAIETQDRASAREVRRLTKQATFFLIFWLFGIGSLVAIFNGLKARKLIRASNDRIPGMVGAWVCISVGLLEIALALRFVFTGRI